VWGIWVEPNASVHFESAGTLIEVKGGLIGTITPNTSGTTKTIEFKSKAKGDSEPETCVGMDGKTKKISQLTEEAHNGKPETSALTGKATLTFSVATEIMDPS
jgi:hypothetical protein